MKCTKHWYKLHAFHWNSDDSMAPKSGGCCFLVSCVPACGATLHATGGRVWRETWRGRAVCWEVCVTTLQWKILSRFCECFLQTRQLKECLCVNYRWRQKVKKQKKQQKSYLFLRIYDKKKHLCSAILFCVNAKNMSEILLAFYVLFFSGPSGSF